MTAGGSEHVELRPGGRTARPTAQIGTAIIARQPGYQPGRVISIEEVMKQFGVSRSMAREVLQELGQKRLVKLQARVGAAIQHSKQWDVLDHEVIAWQLASEERRSFMYYLSELRCAIEPAAAELAAVRAAPETRNDLVQLSNELRRLGSGPGAEIFSRADAEGRAHRARYQEVDVKFHRAVLDGSQNSMFIALHWPIEEALRFRIEEDSVVLRGEGRGLAGIKRFPREPNVDALWLHHGLAHSVGQRQPYAARLYAQAIFVETRTTVLPHPLATGLVETLSDILPKDLTDDLGCGGRKKTWDEFQEAIFAMREEAFKARDSKSGTVQNNSSVSA